MKNITIKCKNLKISNDNPVCLIAGPCQLENEQHAIDMAGKIKEITKKYQLGFIYKTSFDKANRTSIKGKRGVGLNRAQKYGIAFDSYKQWVDKEITVIAQIEHIEAVHNLDKILDVEGIDGIIVGPYDLSASMGYPGDYDRDDVRKALSNIDIITKKKNKPLGFHVVESNHEKVLEKVQKGYSFLAFSLDFFFLGDRAREEMKALKSKL